MLKTKGQEISFKGQIIKNDFINSRRKSRANEYIIFITGIERCEIKLSLRDEIATKATNFRAQEMKSLLKAKFPFKSSFSSDEHVFDENNKNAYL